MHLLRTKEQVREWQREQRLHLLERPVRAHRVVAGATVVRSTHLVSGTGACVHIVSFAYVCGIALRAPKADKAPAAFRAACSYANGIEAVNRTRERWLTNG